MEIINKITLLYQKIGQQFVSDFPDQVKYQITRKIDQTDGSFVITIELIALALINEDIHGLCFSTNAQKCSFVDINTFSNENELFYRSDLCYTGYGIAQTISEIDNGVFAPFDEESALETTNTILEFTTSQIPKINILIKELIG